MSATMNSDALERLNHFNGQRLTAADLRSEQSYHMAVRRLLNRSLYSAGIVKGLEVLKHPSDTHKVIVRTGLAFDHLGRELALLADAPVQVMGAPSMSKGVVFGNLLALSYREQRTQRVSDGCAIAAHNQPCSGDLAWGAPTRIAAEVVFEFLDSWPAADSGKIVLAQLELSKECSVERVLPGVRRYATPVKRQQVRSLSLEGEKDIDSANSKVLYFHLAGGYPSEVTLHLRARKFNSLYYTELGNHVHESSVNIGPLTADLSHGHDVDNANTGLDGGHTHKIWIARNTVLIDYTAHFGAQAANQGDCAWLPALIPDPANNDYNIVRYEPDHRHELRGLTAAKKTLTLSVTPTGSTDVKAAGVNDIAVRASQQSLSYVEDLKVLFDELDITSLVLQQLSARPGQAAMWTKLGDGSNTHAIASPDGTGPIDLLKFGIEIGLGQHKLEFRLNRPNVGGNLQYNLYVA